MLYKQQSPVDYVFWYAPSMQDKQLHGDIKVDIVIIGGGIAGLSAAHRLSDQGAAVIVIEKSWCGGGASGKSSGFVTPDSELPLRILQRHYGADAARQLWDFVGYGSDTIRSMIKKYDIACNYQEQDTLVVANSSQAGKSLLEEHKDRLANGYDSIFYHRDELSSVIGSQAYYAGVRYGSTFGINAFKYCQQLKNILQERGVKIYEETPALSITEQYVTTPSARIAADHIIICADYGTADLGFLKNDIYHVQTFLMMSLPLSDDQVHALFPQQPCMTWDTDMIYTYFRLLENRLMIGGGSLWTTYARDTQCHAHRMVKKLSRYGAAKFPQVPLHFEYFWPGMLGVSKDLLPIVGAIPDNPRILVAAACAGLPWATAAGNYCAEKILSGRSELDYALSPSRRYPRIDRVQSLLGTPYTFALSHLMTLYW